VSLIVCFLFVEPTVCVKREVPAALTDNYWIQSSADDFLCVCACACALSVCVRERARERERKGCSLWTSERFSWMYILR